MRRTKTLQTIYNAFLGIVNNKSLWELGQIVKTIAGARRLVAELWKATNYDIDDKLKLKTRDGYTLALSGSFTDLWSDNVNLYARRNGDLVVIHPGLTAYTTLKSSVGTPICYTKAGDEIVWTDNDSLEYIRDGGSHAFKDPVAENKLPAPAGNLVEFFRGKLFIAKNNVIYQTDPLARREAAIDHTLTGCTRQLASDVQLMKAVDDGMWFSDEEGLYFGLGLDLSTMKLQKIVSYPVKFNAAVQIDGLLFAEPLAGTCYAVASSRGIGIIGNTGFYRNITEKDYTMLQGDKVAMLFKQTSSLNQIITVVKEN